MGGGGGFVQFCDEEYVGLEVRDPHFHVHHLLHHQIQNLLYLFFPSSTVKEKKKKITPIHYHPVPDFVFFRLFIYSSFVLGSPNLCFYPNYLVLFWLPPSLLFPKQLVCFKRNSREILNKIWVFVSRPIFFFNLILLGTPGVRDPYQIQVPHLSPFASLVHSSNRTPFTLFLSFFLFLFYFSPSLFILSLNDSCLRCLYDWVLTGKVYLS